MREAIFSKDFIQNIKNIFKESKESNEYKKLKSKQDFLEYGLKQYSQLKLLKQYESIPYEEVKLKLLKHLDKCLSNLDLNDITYSHIINSTNQQKLKYDIIRYMTCFMDMYLIARVFRKFKQKEKYILKNLKI